MRLGPQGQWRFLTNPMERYVSAHCCQFNCPLSGSIPLLMPLYMTMYNCICFSHAFVYNYKCCNHALNCQSKPYLFSYLNCHPLIVNTSPEVGAQDGDGRKCNGAGMASPPQPDFRRCRCGLTCMISAYLSYIRYLTYFFTRPGHRKLGVTRVLYDPSFSEKGVLLAATRVRRNPNPFDFELPMIIKEYDPDRKKRRRDQQVSHARRSMNKGGGKYGRHKDPPPNRLN